MGRKSKSIEILQNLSGVEAYAAQGFSDVQIANRLGISPSTFYDYKKRFSDFSESIKRGKESADLAVETALVMAATGYMVLEAVYVPKRDKEDNVMYDGDGHPIMEIQKQIKRYIKPDITAQIFWLKNRKPDEWFDRKAKEIERLDAGDDIDGAI